MYVGLASGRLWCLTYALGEIDGKRMLMMFVEPKRVVQKCGCQKRDSSY